jgi:hypothetical protein
VVLLELLTGRRAVDLNQGPNDQNLVLQVRKISSSFNRLWFSTSKILATENDRPVNVWSFVFSGKEHIE